MKLSRLLVAVACIGASLVIAAPAANAGSTGDSCEVLQDLDDAFSSVGTSFSGDDFDTRELTQLGKAFRTAAKKAGSETPKKVKKALKNLGKFYDALAGADSPVEAASVYARNARKYQKAATDFATYLGTECFAVSSPSSSSSGRTGSSGSTSKGSATVTLDDSEYEFGDAAGCTIAGGNVFATFEDGDDMVSLTAADDVVLVRMTIDGVNWVDTGSAPDPDVSGQRVTWTGEMAELDGGDSPVDAMIEFAC